MGCRRGARWGRSKCASARRRFKDSRKAVTRQDRRKVPNKNTTLGALIPIRSSFTEPRRARKRKNATRVINRMSDVIELYINDFMRGSSAETKKSKRYCQALFIVAHIRSSQYVETVWDHIAETDGKFNALREKENPRQRLVEVQGLSTQTAWGVGAESSLITASTSGSGPPAGTDGGWSVDEGTNKRGTDVEATSKGKVPHNSFSYYFITQLLLCGGGSYG